MNTIKPSGTHGGLKRLGLRVGDILESVFPNFKDAPGAQARGKVVRSQFFIFWKQSSSIDDATTFLEALLDQVFLIIDSKGNPPHNVTMDSLVNTIAFITLLLPFKTTSPKLLTFFSRWNERTQDPARDPSREYPALRDTIRVLSMRLDDSPKSLQNFLGPLIVGASTLQTAQDVQMLSSITRVPALDDADVKSNEFGFALSYLTKLVASGGPDAQVLVLSTLLNKSLTLPQQLKMNPRVAETSLFGLLHMMRVVLAANAVTNAAFLAKAILIVQQLLLWPEPWGSVARGVVEAFQSELLFPGWSRRQLLAAEAAVVDYAGLELEPGYRALKPLFYLHDAEDLSVSAALNVLDASSFSSTQPVRPAPSQADPTGGLALPAPIEALALLQALTPDASLAPGGADALAAALQRLSPADVAALAAQLKETEGAVAAAPEAAQQTRVAAADAMVADIMARAAAAPAGAQGFVIPVQPLGPNVPADAANYNPPLPATEHVRLGVMLKAAPGALDDAAGIAGEADAAALASHCGYAYSRLFALARAYSAEVNARNGTPREVRIVVAGGDALLHHVAAAYTALRANQPAMLRGLAFRFFLAPFARSALAGYVARHDSWYQRHVFAPLRSPALLVPWLRSDESELQSSDEALPLPPTAFLRESMVAYARDGGATLHCHLHRLEGFPDARAEPGTGEAVTFLQRVELGLAVAVDEFRVKQRRPTGWRVEDALRDKTCTVAVATGQDLAVRYTKLDLAGRRQAEVVDDFVPFSSVLLSAVPRRGDQTHPSSPSSPALELFAQTHKVDKAKVKRSLLSLEPRQHVCEVTITAAAGAKFRVLVDGALYGPYAAVRVTPALDARGVHATFPVQTFAPINDVV